ncbi:MAG: hypothetical protein WAL22_07125 [Solirubrobacteraceae bacterium]
MPRFGRRQHEPDAGAPGSAGSEAAERAFAEALDVARADLAAVADEVGVIDFDVQSPAASPRAGDHYDEALRSFMLAGEQLERAQQPADLVAVGGALERARYELACARALLDGVEPPARTAPCLFDPRHGPSVAEVTWAPRVGEAVALAARPVPVCAADARRLAEEAAPDIRIVSVGGRPKPYWGVPVLYGPLLVGYYDRFGGTQRLEALLRGTPLGDALAAGR